jgi:hypothetical protein
MIGNRIMAALHHDRDGCAARFHDASLPAFGREIGLPSG